LEKFTQQKTYMTTARFSPIAVVGMAGLFPGASELHIFWQNIINKVDTVSDVPRNRWIVDPDAMYHPDPLPDKAISKRACLIHDFKFDPQGFDIDQELLKVLDPLYHMVLYTAKTAIDDLANRYLNKRRTGVILAAIVLPTDTSTSISSEILGGAFEESLFGHSTVHFPDRNQSLAGKVTSLPAAILAKSLGLGGGSYTLDAACASSLYAVKLACDELAAHRAEAMLVGGVSRPECLYTQVGFSQLHALSPSGRCAPFDEGADGLVVGEGAGIFILKRLDDALRDRDPVFGIIRGIGLSNDMRGNLLAPDSEGQLRAMHDAYESAGWSPGDIDLIECHGAGTPVGDAVELFSLKNLWGDSGWHAEQCAIGSVKSMIGHLLTAAGAAGMAKTLLALTHKILPPSLHFNRAPEKSPLHNSPFRVQTLAEEWEQKANLRPRRAAVSAFGFGGINAHLLLEEWDPETFELQRPKSKISGSSATTRRSKHTLKNAVNSIQQEVAISSEQQDAIAIVGMAAAFGSIDSLRKFQEVIYNGETNIGQQPKCRWKACVNLAGNRFDKKFLSGGYMDELALNVSDFHIPPNEIPDILPQHLLMLKIAIQAMQDAGFPLREDRPRMGAIIGIDFDFEATNFHFRWNLGNAIELWKKKYGLDLDDEQIRSWLNSLLDSWEPPLTPARTLGALGGIIASRIARELRFGGPSFVVSGDETSGLKALEIGVRSLQRKETDAYLVGSVDFCGDIRTMITSAAIRRFSKKGEIRPFDVSADGILMGEGATALVLKRFADAVSDGNRVYAVAKGIGCASGGGVETNTASKETYMLSLKRAFKDAGLSPGAISYFETHGSGDPLEDNVETEALHDFFSNRKDSCAIGALKPNIGHTGATAGLAALVKTSLCIYQEIIPPLVNFTSPANSLWRDQTFHLPAFAQYWLRDAKDGPRTAAVGAMTPDGNCSTVILQGTDYTLAAKLPEITVNERKKPLGLKPIGLFVVEGNSKNSLNESLDTLSRHVKQWIDNQEPIEMAASNWYRSKPSHSEKTRAMTLLACDLIQLEKLIAEAHRAIATNQTRKINGPGSIGYSPAPKIRSSKIAFVYPGSGNHYIGMGREIGLQWPEILRKMDTTTPQLRSQMLPQYYIPQRVSWETGWQQAAYHSLISDPLNVIFGQVAHGGVVSELVKNFGITPTAIIGYSLGESAGLFASGAWPDRNEMLQRMRHTNLFTTELCGPCNAARKSWNIPSDEKFEWRVAVVNRPANALQKVIGGLAKVRLLIVNSPDECVIGGDKEDVAAAIRQLSCETFYLDGVVTVHCDAAVPVAAAYKRLHIFPVNPPRDVCFYSCALGRSYSLSSESAASSILNQALSGFDFTATIKQAYQDGIQVFLEMGPGASCTRMIGRILAKKPHLALSACHRREDDYLTILKFLGTLISEGLPVDLDNLYSLKSYPLQLQEVGRRDKNSQIKITIGGKTLPSALPRMAEKIQHSEPTLAAIAGRLMPKAQKWANETMPQTAYPTSEVIEAQKKTVKAIADAHKAFLDFSNELNRAYAAAFDVQIRLLEESLQRSQGKNLPRDVVPQPSELAFTRNQCLEFATGSVANVLGPEFALVDTFKTRVRLPDEPLMLVDRILSVEGKKGSLGSGRIVTEHDVLPNAWYLDGERAPVCISVEAGQADLFLSAYLGIDFAVKGERTYRLLDASVIFHRGLPRPGDVIRYKIEIEKFIRQGDTYLFFFHFEGFINNSHLISMSNGCAGFFTEEEIRNSGGIVLDDEDARPLKGKRPDDWVDLVPISPESYDEDAVGALRSGNLANCFGELFRGIELAESLRLPGGRMKLINRIHRLDPGAGRYGLGLIRAEADIQPEDWFLTCHFMDDMVMPGTLMYECCAHTLRVFIQRLGWVTDKPGVCYEPVIGVQSILKCRGPVTPTTKQVIYEVEIKELGYTPEPYIIADAHMYADGHYIVRFKDMSMKMTGITRTEIEAFWQQKARGANNLKKPGKNKPIFDCKKILSFAVGNPSDAFGEPYKVFDQKRFIARLPGPPYSFIDRVIAAEPTAWVLEPGGWVHAEYDVNPEAWYFRSNRTPTMPFFVLLEAALQTCGWLAAYMGSALQSEKDLKFRNLEGRGMIHQDVFADYQTLTMRARLKKVSKAGDIIIEMFDFQVLQANTMIYTGNTAFGFFTPEALAQQKGIRSSDLYSPTSEEATDASWFNFKDEPPLTPADLNTSPASCLTMPSKAIRMIDRIDLYLPAGGPKRLGFVRASKHVDPTEWFFKAHFFQDPVCPGSLGIESFLQLIKFVAIDRWGERIDNHRFEHLSATTHKWVYRGQIIPQNKKIEVEVVVTSIQELPDPVITADGYLKVDGLTIYKMENFGFRLVPY
jgi:PfaB family protein